MQSPAVRPIDPLKSSSNTRLEGYIYPIIYTHANHLYFTSQGVPHRPPCKKHGWKAVEDGQVITRRRTICWTAPVEGQCQVLPQEEGKDECQFSVFVSINLSHSHYRPTSCAAGRRP